MRLAAIDVDALVELVWVAPVAGLTVVVAFAMVIRGSARAADARREGRALAVGGHALLALVGAVLVTAAVVFGLVIMASE